MPDCFPTAGLRSRPLTGTEITGIGFIAEIATWRKTHVYSVAFSWLALGTYSSVAIPRR